MKNSYLCNIVAKRTFVAQFARKASDKCFLVDEKVLDSINAKLRVSECSAMFTSTMPNVSNFERKFKKQD